jgi:hypothetical protein
VRIDLTTGNLSGYAWGENIGWINFEGISVLQWTEILFNWVESRYPGILAPSPQLTLENSGIFYRYYPNTNVAIRTFENSLFLLDHLGILHNLGSLNDWFHHVSGF